MPYPYILENENKNQAETLWNRNAQVAFPSSFHPLQSPAHGGESAPAKSFKNICRVPEQDLFNSYIKETTGFDTTEEYCLEPPRHLLIIGDTDGLERAKAVESILSYMRSQYGIFENDDFLVRRIKRRQQLKDLMASIPDSSLASVAYFGHGTERYLPLDLSSISRNSLLSAEDLQALDGKLFDNAPIRLFGCNTYLLARHLAKRLNTDAWGNNGSTKGLAPICGHYLPVAPAVEHYLPGGFKGTTSFYPGDLLQSYHDIRH